VLIRNLLKGCITNCTTFVKNCWMPKAAFNMQNVRIITSSIQKVIKIIANLKSNVNNDMIIS
ncbi:hypothetical protein COBT_003644, partial [Conglomerata obtusa]